ncbi:hypothetical protein N7519_009325 [Penicillium mononematosum]|uniref:uncharacterized protein n=1 Tax=Penicillium mononematosum TaxID=268346 RepID=UPI002548D6B3|nr:uncharacterized protein N7519_009325 [Penicillium mononematosum]KAJ6178864.1 hypothetical protein N7519_009325 [Penicillium mononematosum]
MSSGLQTSILTARYTLIGGRKVNQSLYGRTAYHLSLSLPITMLGAVLNINERAHSSGLHYVAVSRVHTLPGIVFEETINFDRIQPARPTPTMLMRLDDRRCRAPQHMVLLIPIPSPTATLTLRPIGSIYPVVRHNRLFVYRSLLGARRPSPTP